jgi:hypothetical protein
MPRATTLVILLVFALLGSALVLHATKEGIGTSPDSIAYLQASRNLLSGKGLSLPTDDGKTKPMTHWPPLYPALLAAIGYCGIDPFDAARGLNAVLFAASILATGLTAYAVSRGSDWTAVFASGLFLFSARILYAHSMAWSEPTFIILCLLGLILMGRNLETHKLAILVGCAAVTALAFLTRYAGVALVVTGLIVIGFLDRRIYPGRLRNLFIFAAISCCPMGVWLISCAGLADTTTERSIAFHLNQVAHVRRALDSISQWVVPGLQSERARQIVSVIAIAALLGLVVRWIRSSRRSSAECPKASLAAAVFIPAYLTVLIVSALFFDPGVNFSDRLLSPVLAPGLIFVIGIASSAFGTHRRTVFKLASALLAVTLVGAYACDEAKWVMNASREGIGYTNRTWKESETLRKFRSLSGAIRIYSNAPAAIYLHTGKVAGEIPRKTDLRTRRPNRNFDAELAQMSQAVGTGEAIVVVFDFAGGHNRANEIVDRLGLAAVERLADGTIYGAKE